ncbi:GH25 family lysozyme [Lacipirellula sp.]|uniref:GH25 family lysozyme n=1 Tax=Lacipirellula sp. TaxID=2691419 RepID=UPI003D116475
MRSTARLLSVVCAVLAFHVAHSTCNAQYTYGIDVSNYQSSANWTSLKNAGTMFAFVKATEGVDFVDASFTKHMTNASNAGVYVGPYHFGRINSNTSNPNDAIDEANDFVDAIAPYYQQPGRFLRPVLDVENTPGLSTTAANKAYISEWVRDFIGVVQNRLGMDPIIYCNTSYAATYFTTDLTQYDLWVANYNYSPPAIPPASIDGVWDGWDIWQYTQSGSVSGITGNVDRDVYQGTMDEFLTQFLAVPPTGDFNKDGTVDGNDFLIWQRNFGRTSGVSLATGDANGDKLVNADDLQIWKSGFSGAAAVASVSAVPEPATVTLAIAAGLAVLNFRRRRM